MNSAVRTALTIYVVVVVVEHCASSLHTKHPPQSICHSKYNNWAWSGLVDWAGLPVLPNKVEKPPSPPPLPPSDNTTHFVQCYCTSKATHSLHKTHGSCVCVWVLFFFTMHVECITRSLLHICAHPVFGLSIHIFPFPGQSNVWVSRYRLVWWCWLYVYSGLGLRMCPEWPRERFVL